MKDGVDLYQKLIVGHSSGVNPAYSSVEGADSMLFLEGPSADSFRSLS